MPTYDYQCERCSHEFELFQSISEAPKRKCPECGKHQLRRMFGTGAAVMFKGSGFYQTDYRSDSYRKAAKADKESTSGSGDSKSAESKPAGSKSAEKKTTKEATPAT